MRNPPKMFELRFWVILILAKWMEEEDRALYVYMQDQHKDVNASKRDPTECEKAIVDIYLENYVEVKLTNKFVLEGSEKLVKFLQTFEKNDVNVHTKYESIVNLLFSK